MSSETKVSKIDRKLFIPLADFFSSENQPLEELLSLIQSIGQPTKHLCDYSSYLGFVSEAYVKWVISRFEREIDCFKPTRKTEGEINCGKETYFIDKWGNVIFKKRNGRQITELDGLYEFLDNEENVPVILEVKQRNKPAHSPTKQRYVRFLYHQHPYFCNLTHTTNKNSPNLRSSDGLPYHRKIIFNRKEELMGLASELKREGFRTD